MTSVTFNLFLWFTIVLKINCCVNFYIYIFWHIKYSYVFNYFCITHCVVVVIYEQK